MLRRGKWHICILSVPGYDLYVLQHPSTKANALHTCRNAQDVHSCLLFEEPLDGGSKKHDLVIRVRRDQQSCARLHAAQSGPVANLCKQVLQVRWNVHVHFEIMSENSDTKTCNQLALLLHLLTVAENPSICSGYQVYPGASASPPGGTQLQSAVDQLLYSRHGSASPNVIFGQV